MDTLDYMTNPQYVGSRFIRGIHNLSASERLTEIDELEELLERDKQITIKQRNNNVLCYKAHNRVENLLRD